MLARLDKLRKYSTRRLALFVITCLLPLTVFAVIASTTQANDKPLNVLLVTADDLGLNLSSYGETVIDTPHMDSLAASGVQFDVAYVSQASCSPSRSSIFTGLHSHSTGQYGLASPFTWRSLFNPRFSLHRSLRDKTIPNLLKDAGYTTGLIGKLHVAPEKSFQIDYEPIGPEELVDDSTRNVRWVANAAETFFSDATEQPFFLMVNYSDPHLFWGEDNTWSYSPSQVDGLPETLTSPGPDTIFPFQQVDTPEQRARVAGYYNAVKRLDSGIGLLMDALHNSGHDDDTLVIFISDHGPPFTRAKTTVYEAGIRIPFIVRWPGVSTSMRSSELVSTIDILPTIMDAAGIEFSGEVQGKSLREALSNPEAHVRDYLVAEHHFHSSSVYFPQRAIRDDRYKLIHSLVAGKAAPTTYIDDDDAYAISQGDEYNGSPVQGAFATFANPPEFELYDLQADPVEFFNLAGSQDYTEVQRRLTAALQQYREETNDPFLDTRVLERYLD